MLVQSQRAKVARPRDRVGDNVEDLVEQRETVVSRTFRRAMRITNGEI